MKQKFKYLVLLLCTVSMIAACGKQTVGDDSSAGVSEPQVIAGEEIPSLDEEPSSVEEEISDPEPDIPDDFTWYTSSDDIPPHTPGSDDLPYNITKVGAEDMRYVVDLPDCFDESSAAVVKMLMRMNGYTTCDCFVKYVDYMLDIETYCYCVSFDSNVVWYLYEQGDFTYARANEYFTYQEVIDVCLESVRDYPDSYLYVSPEIRELASTYVDPNSLANALDLNLEDCYWYKVRYSDDLDDEQMLIHKYMAFIAYQYQDGYMTEEFSCTLPYDLHGPNLDGSYNVTMHSTTQVYDVLLDIEGDRYVVYPQGDYRIPELEAKIGSCCVQGHTQYELTQINLNNGRNTYFTDAYISSWVEFTASSNNRVVYDLGVRYYCSQVMTYVYVLQMGQNGIMDDITLWCLDEPRIVHSRYGGARLSEVREYMQ